MALVSCLKVFATETANFLPGSQEPRQSGTAYMEYLVTFKQTVGDSFENLMHMSRVANVSCVCANVALSGIFYLTHPPV